MNRLINWVRTLFGIIALLLLMLLTIIYGVLWVIGLGCFEFNWPLHQEWSSNDGWGWHVINWIAPKDSWLVS